MNKVKEFDMDLNIFMHKCFWMGDHGNEQLMKRDLDNFKEKWAPKESTNLIPKPNELVEDECKHVQSEEPYICSKCHKQVSGVKKYYMKHAVSGMCEYISREEYEEKKSDSCSEKPNSSISISRRDYFAIEVLKVLIKDPIYEGNSIAATDAVFWADALIRELDGEES